MDKMIKNFVVTGALFVAVAYVLTAVNLVKFDAGLYPMLGVAAGVTAVVKDKLLAKYV